jgi:hypothetical protein
MKNLLVLLFVIIYTSGSAQQKLEFKIEGLKDTTIFLARYFGDRLYYADTTKSKNQLLVFNSKKLVGGVYAVVCPGSKYFEFIVDDEDVEMETNLNDFSGSMKVKKSENNKVFYNYIRFLGSKKKESMSIEGEDKEVKMKILDKEVKDYQKVHLFGNPNLLGSKILRMSIDPIIPEEVKSNDTIRYNYILNHYWDNIDLSDNRIIHSPVYHKKLDNFFKIIPQNPDTICLYAHKLISQMDQSSDLFKYSVHHITYKYETSNIMGMDAVFCTYGRKILHNKSMRMGRLNSVS